MRATYIGNDFHGFERGKTYYIQNKIQVVAVPFANVFKPQMCICIYNENGSNWAYYKNLEEVLSNWTF